MDKDLQTAADYLRENGCTCVLCKGERLYSSFEKGIKPLLDFIKSDISFDGFSAADTVVGRAAGFLYIRLGVKSVYANVLSERAKEVFEENDISVIFEKLVPNIQGKFGICPMEQAVEHVSSSEDALSAIEKTIEQLMHSKRQNS